MGNAFPSTTAAKAESNESRKLVEDMLKENKVVVFSATYCPYCVKAKDAIASVGEEPKVVELDEHPDGRAIHQVVVQMTGQRTVPVVFVGGQNIGGGDDTARMAASGELRRRLDDLAR